MEYFDIESYLDNSLNQTELEDFNAEMNQNPALKKQVEIQQKLTQHLQTQLLREHVSAVLEDKPATNIPRTWTWIIVCVFLTGMVGYLYVSNHKSSSPGSRIIPGPGSHMDTLPHVPSQVQPVETSPHDGMNKELQKSRPIAQTNPTLVPPEYPAPNIRGEQDVNKSKKVVLDKIWYTKFPPDNTKFNVPFSQPADLLARRNFKDAFIQLDLQERTLFENDTLRFLKGYCLLEMGEGADAIRYFDQLERSQPKWKSELQWYRGLALLLSGETKKAIRQFKEIAGTPDHPFRPQSQKAIELLK